MDYTPDDYLNDLNQLVDSFYYERCHECDDDAHAHEFSPDPLGKPHAWCIFPADYDDRDDRMVRLRRRLANEFGREAEDFSGNLPEGAWRNADIAMSVFFGRQE